MDDIEFKSVGYKGAFERAQEMTDSQLYSAFDHLFHPSLGSEVRGLSEISVRIAKEAEFPCKDEGIIGKVTGIRNDYKSSDETHHEYLERMLQAFGSEIVQNQDIVRVMNGDVVLLYCCDGSTYQRMEEDGRNSAKISGFNMEYFGCDADRVFNPKYDKKLDKPNLVRFLD